MALSIFGTGAGNDPFSQMDRVMDRAFDRAFGRGLMGPAYTASVDLMPAPVSDQADMFALLGGSAHPMDIIEKDSHYEIHADAPGMSPEDISVECNQGVLTVRGQHAETKEHKDKAGRVHRSERVKRSFMRSFGLPKNATDDNITASLDRGVLTVCVPKTPEAEKPQPKRIAVSMGNKTSQSSQGRLQEGKEMRDA